LISSAPRTRVTALAALFFAALTLRPQIVGVAPLFPQVEDALGTSHAVVGLLGTIPVLCMGIFAPVAAILAGRIGTRRAMTIALASIGIFGLARAVAPSAWLLVLLTIPVGMGMGIGNAISPIAVKERVPDRPATGTGVYTTGIQIGSTSSAALAVPIAGLLGGWRAAFIAFSAVTCVILVAWLVLMRGESAHVRTATLPHFPLRSSRAWLLVAVFASMGGAYYGLNAWIPDAYGERGWSEGHAGALLVAMNLTAIPSSFVIPWLSDRFGGRQRWLFVLSFVFLTGATGLVAFPGGAFGWSLLAGVSQGGMFALTMTLPLDLEDRPERVGGLVAMMLGLGYTIAALSPFVLGGVRDLTGTFDGPLWVVVGLIVGLIVWVALLGRVTTHRDVASETSGI
jgi:MFS transporter, CP family, cyanate transporter